MTELIEPGHLFSQHSLNTYLRCPRRFLLKYVDKQPWPMPAEENPRDYQKHLLRGRIFHEWLERQHLGLDIEPIVASCQDPQLQEWWRAVKRFDRDSLPENLRQAELPIVVPIGEYRLYARYDYVALNFGGEAVIVDWKTLEFRPTLRVLRRRMQTQVYLYTLVSAGHVLTGGIPIDPDRARMLYWFANYPKENASISYSSAAFQRDKVNLLELAQKIAHQPRDSFTRTDDARLCSYCNYRSLCGREVGDAGNQKSWLDEDIDFDMELEQAPELEY